MPRRPSVIAHVAIALDGATTGFEPRVGPYYELAATWSEDVVDGDLVWLRYRPDARVGQAGSAEVSMS